MSAVRKTQPLFWMSRSLAKRSVTARGSFSTSPYLSTDQDPAWRHTPTQVRCSGQERHMDIYLPKLNLRDRQIFNFGVWCQMTSSEAFTETMVSHGVTNMFGIVGSAFMDALDIFPAAGIRYSTASQNMHVSKKPIIGQNIKVLPDDLW